MLYLPPDITGCCPHLLAELDLRSSRLGLAEEQPDDFERCRNICHDLRNELLARELRRELEAIRQSQAQHAMPEMEQSYRN